MTTHLSPNLLRNAKLLIAAVQLKQSHGLLYAMRFLEDYDFSSSVIWEVLGLISAEAAQESPSC
jgi:hypothetical protein